MQLLYFSTFVSKHVPSGFIALHNMYVSKENNRCIIVNMWV